MVGSGNVIVEAGENNNDDGKSEKDAGEIEKTEAREVVGYKACKTTSRKWWIYTEVIHRNHII